VAVERPRRVFAIGGGGFSSEPENALLDDYLLSLAPPGRAPRICFVGTASGDTPDYRARFRAAFADGRCAASELTLFERTVHDLDAFLAEQDIVYVGGGSTLNLLAVWRAHGVDRSIRRAYEQGVVMAGISAGMNCWFEASITDSFALDRLQPLPDGLGLIAGSACPHYDGEEQRRPTYRAAVADGLAAGHAAEDGVGLLFEEGELGEAVSSRPAARAYRVALRSGVVIEEELPTRYLGSQFSAASQPARQ
jgi:dipeptidase E